MTDIITTEIVISDFLKGLKSLPSMVQRTDLVTVKDINPKSGKEFTSKDKRVLGIPEDNETTWLPFHLSVHDNTRFNVLAKACKRTSFQLGAEIMIAWFDEHRDDIEAEVQSMLKDEKSIEDLEKEVETAKRKFEASMARLTAKKG